MHEKKISKQVGSHEIIDSMIVKYLVYEFS